MSSFESASSETLASVNPRAAAGRLVPYFYAATLFVSALLLFSIQPMFAKMVLPQLGGAPAGWSVAMVFFQTALLAGLCCPPCFRPGLLAPPAPPWPPCCPRRAPV